MSEYDLSNGRKGNKAAAAAIVPTQGKSAEYLAPSLRDITDEAERALRKAADAIEQAEARAEAAEKIVKAAANLIAAKGRYNTSVAYDLLAAAIAAGKLCP
jgi:hypothetical protein